MAFFSIIGCWLFLSSLLVSFVITGYLGGFVIGGRLATVTGIIIGLPLRKIFTLM